MGAPTRSSSALRLLVVDADPSARAVLKAGLQARIPRPVVVVEAEDAPGAAVALAGGGFHAVTIDLSSVGGLKGFAALASGAGAATVYATASGADVRDAVAAVRAGAADVLEKPVDGHAFARRIERHAPLAEPAAEPGEGILSQSPAMRGLLDQIARIAPSPAPVFVFGASGTGKSLVARAVHARSRRRGGPLVMVDCAGDDRTDLLAELAAPGGAFDRAAGGTLVLDEAGRLPDAVQTLLLRALDSGEIGAGADRRAVDVRLVATTNRPAEAASGPDGLRPDLYFRLAVLPLRVPTLAERREDVTPLAEDFLRRMAREAGVRPPRLAAAAERLLAEHGWPGNGRELRNLCERLVALHEGAVVTADLLEPLIGAPGVVRGEPVADPASVRPLWMEEARIIEEAILAFGGNIARAAAALQISPSTIYRKRRGGGEDSPAAGWAAAE